MSGIKPQKIKYLIVTLNIGGDVNRHVLFKKQMKFLIQYASFGKKIMTFCLYHKT